LQVVGDDLDIGLVALMKFNDRRDASAPGKNLLRTIGEKAGWDWTIDVRPSREFSVGYSTLMGE